MVWTGYYTCMSAQKNNVSPGRIRSVFHREEIEGAQIYTESVIS